MQPSDKGVVFPCLPSFFNQPSTCKTNMRKSLQNLASNVNQLSLGVHKERDYKYDELDFQAFL
jgi:hypothetical protein